MCGYEEIAHTADWAIRVWAPDLMGLFETAAQGMYDLLGVEPAEGTQVRREVSLQAIDAESLLVAFLNELLYILEDGVAIGSFQMTVTGQALAGILIGGKSSGQSKEIKAVTYHNLTIEATGRGMEATVVFDV